MKNIAKPLNSHVDSTSPPRIAIVLSTWNGEQYLPELLESLRLQTWVHWDLWVRDDGSVDGTLAILQDFSKKMNDKSTGSRIHVIEGENMGVVQSYFTLISRIHGSYTAYAFSDQDDVWLPVKLERAASAIVNHQSGDNGDNLPFLYHSGQLLVDQRFGRQTMSSAPVRTGFANALIQNQVVGCTMVINPALRECLLHGISSQPGSDPVSGIIMHDWWCYMLASGLGRIVYDPGPVIIFRRHEKSTTPVAANPRLELLKRMATLRKRNWAILHIMRQAETFAKMYFDNEDQTTVSNGSAPMRNRIETANICKLSGHNRQLLISLITLRTSGFLKRLHYLFMGEHKRAGILDTLIFRLMVLIRRF